MGIRKSFHSVTSVLAVLAVIASLVSAASAATEQVIYSFTGKPDGEYADTDLVRDKAGNIYGTTVLGGKYGAGTIFKLTRFGTETVLYPFQGQSDGGEPYKGVTLDAQGNIYGTAGVAGKYVGPCVDTGCGTVFKLTKSGGGYSFSVIHRFTGGNDGYGPGSGVTLDKHGNVYGVTPTGGANSAGVVYQLNQDSSGKWREKIIHTFTGGADGLGGSAGRLLLDAAGNLYGVCTAGRRESEGSGLRTLARDRWQMEIHGALPIQG
jgi:uncharacterized repeat protein (TIGR03803 family)